MKNFSQFFLKMMLTSVVFLTVIVVATAQSWNQVLKATAKNDGGSSARTEEDYYGYSVAISGNYAIVGAHYEDEDANGLNPVPDAGAAYILFNNAGTWTQVKKIVSPFREMQYFGASVSISGGYAIVGASTEGEDASEANTIGGAGAAYIYKKDQGGTDNWGLIRKIIAPVRAENDLFGFSVSIDGDYVIVGAYLEDQDSDGNNAVSQSGAAYIFKKDQGGADNWGLVKKITATNRNIDDWFGYSVSISSEYAIVGAWREDDDVAEANPLSEAGSAYIFYKGVGESWAQQKKITASVRGVDDHFGFSVSISGEYAIVGADQEDEDANELNTMNKSGSAYIFKRNFGGSDNWGQLKKITASTRKALNYFGHSVSVTADYAIVGAVFDDASPFLTNTGTAYLFRKDQTGADQWGQVQKIIASTPAIQDSFGWVVAISGDHAIVGAHGEDEDELDANTLSNSGSAYIFKLNNSALPVSLVTFEAEQKEGQALLRWSTAQEINSDYFEVQKSQNGQLWKAIGNVSAAGSNNSLLGYSFVDGDIDLESGPDQENLYRLKMVDLDGRFTFSRIVSIRFSENMQSFLYPNPVTYELYFNSPLKGKIESISLTNTSGEVIYQSSLNERTPISVKHLTPGVYLARIRQKAGKVIVQKLLVR